ncbi:MAG: pectin esterase [Firmicutes bacterium]|nr:pectin esterase [Bacillota bacterium]
MADYYLSPGDNLQEAADKALPGDTLHLKEGCYRQKVVLRAPSITLVGEGPEKTVLTGSDYARKLDEQGREYNTFRTYTLAVTADDITLRSLSIRNDALDPVSKGQEVALSVYGDRFHMEKCHLFSTQDTLFLGPLPLDLVARYKDFLPDELRKSHPLKMDISDCLIEGSVDYIFGCGSCLFNACEIRQIPDGRTNGFIAAPAHWEEMSEGFTFRYCSFTCDPSVPEKSIYLARPWRDFGLCSFESCAYGPHIKPEGFDSWRGSSRHLTARFFEAPAVPGRAAWVRQPDRSAPEAVLS